MSPADLAALRVQVAGDGGYFAAKCRALLALHDTMHETLTATQARCTELLLEVRQLRAKPRARGSLYGGKPDAGPIKRQPDTIKFTITATVADDGTAGPTKVSSTGPFCSRPDEVSAAGYARVAVTSSLTQGWAVQAAKDCAAEQGADAQASRPTGNRNLEPVELENEDTNPPAEACSAAERGYVRRTDRPGRWREENDEEYEARLARLRRAGLRVP